MIDKSSRFIGLVRLELLLMLASILLVFQLFPSLAWQIIRVADVRHWSRGTWMGLNVIIVFGLFGIRFGRELHQEWVRVRTNGKAARRKSGDKQLAFKEERALYERMAEARKRQVI